MEFAPVLSVFLENVSMNLLASLLFSNLMMTKVFKSSFVPNLSIVKS